MVAPDALPLSVMLLPAHKETGVTDAITAVGKAFTVTGDVVAVTVHAPVTTDKEYMPEETVPDVNEAGFKSVEVKPEGPDHE